MNPTSRSPLPFPALVHRRRFLNSSAGTAAALMVHSSLAAKQEQTEVRIGIVGFGGRGSGAVNDSLSINQNIQLVAAADVYQDNCVSKIQQLSRRFPDKIKLPLDKMHGGLDGYKRVLEDPNVDLVLMTTPPGFRPGYVLEAVQAGKHVFAEKPSCVDPAGYRKCIQAHDLAVANGTAIVTGTQYRRQTNYMAAVEQIRSGAIGDIVSATTRYCADGIWYRVRKDGMSDAEYQIYNWMHFIWLSGDQIVEQAVHNIDVLNWVMGTVPETAYGSGGRFTRPEDSEMWDAMCIDYLYPGNRVLSFMCRQIPGSQNDNGNTIYGTEGFCTIDAGSGFSRIFDRDGNEKWSKQGSISDAYQQEHKDLVDSIRAGKPIVELRDTADSSLTAVMGRLACYTGQKVSWKFLTEQSRQNLFPEKLTWDSSLPRPQWAVPGKTPLV